MSKSKGTKYRVGVIGCGGTSGHFFTGFGACPDDTEVAAICDVAPSQMERQQAAYPEVCGRSATYTDYRKMLAEADLDIVCVCSFSDKHLEHVETCMTAGKHVFVEKPVGYDLEEARRLRYLTGKHPELKVAVAYSLRYYKAFMELKALIAAGELGEIVSGEICYCHGHRRRWRERGSEEPEPGGRDESDAGGAPAGPAPAAEHRPRWPRHPYEDRGGNYKRSSQLVHATHPWDMARYMLGEVREVFAARGPCAMGILWMESGALCHVLAGSVRRTTVGYMQHQVVQVHGRLGSGWVVRGREEPYPWQSLYKTDGDVQPCPSVSDVPDSSHGAALRTRNLLDAIEGKAELICPLIDGVKTTELLHALWLSERMQVKVPVLPANHTG